MNLNLSILTALLQKLDQPYTIEDNLLIIKPTSYGMAKSLDNGIFEVIEAGITFHLHVDLTRFDAIDYMAKTVKNYVSLIEYTN